MFWLPWCTWHRHCSFKWRNWAQWLNLVSIMCSRIISLMKSRNPNSFFPPRPKRIFTDFWWKDELVSNIWSWIELRLCPPVIKFLWVAEYHYLSIHYSIVVQWQVIPAVMETVIPGTAVTRLGLPPRDICCSAPTGSGKTLSFVLPIVQVNATHIFSFTWIKS